MTIAFEYGAEQPSVIPQVVIMTIADKKFSFAPKSGRPYLLFFYGGKKNMSYKEKKNKGGEKGEEEGWS